MVVCIILNFFFSLRSFFSLSKKNKEEQVPAYSEIQRTERIIQAAGTGIHIHQMRTKQLLYVLQFVVVIHVYVHTWTRTRAC